MSSLVFRATDQLQGSQYAMIYYVTCYYLDICNSRVRVSKQIGNHRVLNKRPLLYSQPTWRIFNLSFARVEFDKISNLKTKLLPVVSSICL